MKMFAWQDVKSVRFHRLSGNFIFSGNPHQNVKVSCRIQNFSSFLTIFTNRLKPELYTKSLEDYNQYKKIFLCGCSLV